MLIAPGILPVSRSSWGSRTSLFIVSYNTYVERGEEIAVRGCWDIIGRWMDGCYVPLPTMTTSSLGSFPSTSFLISSKPQIRLFGTWLSGPEYHLRTPVTDRGLVHLASGRAATPEHVLAAQAEMETEAGAAMPRGEMRRRRTRWQACLVAIALLSCFVLYLYSIVQRELWRKRRLEVL